MPAYNNNIPLGSDKFSSSQPLIKDNFEALQDAQDRNHIGLSDLSNSGRHDVIQSKEQSGDPAALAGYGSLYTKDSTGTQLFFEDDLGVVMQLTRNFTDATEGQVVLPGGPIFKWGFKTGLATGASVTFPVAFPSVCHQVQLTGLQFNTSSVNRTYMIQKIGATPTISTTGFTFRTDESTANSSFYYYAIGF